MTSSSGASIGRLTGRDGRRWPRRPWRSVLARGAIAAVVALGASASPAWSDDLPPGLPETGCTGPTLLESGAKGVFCVPANWNHQLVLFAHGYSDPATPPSFQNLDTPLGGTTVPKLVTSLGYAFAATTYRDSGLAIATGAADLIELRRAFIADHPDVARTYATGVSEGGLVVARLAERRRSVTGVDGALSACGPIGSLKKQLDHFGDFRVLFDVFFPGLLPRWTPRAETIPPEVIAGWRSGALKQAVIAALARALADPEIRARVAALLATSQLTVDTEDPEAVGRAVLEVLDYNVVGTNDAIARLGGNPFSNLLRWYSGTGSFATDLLVNRQVARFAPDPTALLTLALRYETTGRLKVPLVSLHTSGDHVVPAWQQRLYAAKARLAGRRRLFTAMPLVDRFGHCVFTPQEVVAAFNTLVAAASVHR